MATTAWGSGLSADELLALAGHVELTATRLASDALLLDWVRFAGTPRHCWKFDEGAGTVAYDTGSSPVNTNIMAGTWETTAPWLGPADLNPNWTDAYLNETYTLSAGVTVEAWALPKPDTNQRVLVQCYPIGDGPRLLFNYPQPGDIWVDGWDAGFGSAGGIVTESWHHIAVVWSNAGTKLYLDGTQVGSSATVLGNAYIGYWRMGCQTSNWTRPWSPGKVGDTAIHTTAKYTAAFTPHRYEQGAAVLTKAAESAARKVTGVDWAGTFGAGSGSVYRVQVNTGTDVSPAWVTVGGDNPTSPVTGLDLTVQAGVTRWVRAYLNPKADTLQSETPILSALRVTHNAAGGGAPRIYAPQRFGPSLIPLGGLL